MFSDSVFNCCYRHLEVGIMDSSSQHKEEITASVNECDHSTGSTTTSSEPKEEVVARPDNFDGAGKGIISSIKSKDEEPPATVAKTTTVAATPTSVVNVTAVANTIASTETADIAISITAAATTTTTRDKESQMDSQRCSVTCQTLTLEALQTLSGREYVFYQH